MIGKKRRVTSIAVIAVCVVLGAGVIGGITFMLRQGTSSLPVVGQAPEFSAVNVDGRTVSMDSLNGKVRLVTWFYSHCPDECPATAAYMQQVQDKFKQQNLFGNKVAFVSISIDPKGDTPDAVRKFGEHAGADTSGWYFLRPTAAQLPALLKQWNIQVQDTSDPEKIEHVIETDLVDQSGNIRKKYTEDVLPVTQVESDIQNLLSRGL